MNSTGAGVSTFSSTGVSRSGSASSGTGAAVSVSGSSVVVPYSAVALYKGATPTSGFL